MYRFLREFKHTLFFWKGRSKGIVKTQNITLDQIRAVFFPKNFYERYQYLGSIPFVDDIMISSLVVAMDYAAKPKWCPRWFLRFLHLFGSDNSIIRVRNWTLHNLSRRLTKGIMMYDYKTKWNYYDLRISISGPQHLQDLADAIELYTYRKGAKEEILGELNKMPEAKDKFKDYDSLESLRNLFHKLKTDTYEQE
jgi:hypothetical protein